MYQTPADSNSMAEPSRSVTPTSPKSMPFQGEFFSKESATAREIFFKIFLGGTFMITVAIFAIFSIYWGALWKTTDHTHNLVGYVVDFDGGNVGSSVVEALQRVSGQRGFITWTTKSASDFPGGVEQVRNDIANEDAWAAVVINAGATANLNAAVSAADASYRGTNAVTAFGSEGRNENAFRSFIRPSVDVPLQQLSVQFASRFVGQIAGQANFNTIATNAPTILVQPISYTLVNLNPFDVPVAAAVTFVGMIYLLIVSFIVTMTLLGAREASGLARSLKTSSLIRLRLAAPLFAYFVLSCIFALLSLAFQVPFDRHYGKAGFVIYWMLCFFAMSALGLALEFAITVLGSRFTPFFLLMWVITNVSVALFPIPIYPAVFKYGYAAPFFSVSEGTRTVLFGTKNHLVLNFGILAAWAAISIITVSVAQWLVRRTDANALKKNQTDAEKL